MPAKNKYQSIFETAIDGVIVINKRGIISEINSSALLLFLYKKDELVGENISILMENPHSKNHDGYMQSYQKSRQPKIIGIGREVEGLKKDGTVFPFRLAVSAFEDGGEEFYTGVIHDMTKQKKQESYIQEYSKELEDKFEERSKLLEQEVELKIEAQNALVASQKLYETIAINFPNGTITVLDLDFNIVFIEGRDLKKKGFGTEQLIGKNYFSLLPEATRDVVQDSVSLVVEGTEQSFELKLSENTYKARCVPLFNSKGVVHQILMVENNITKQKNAEKKIYDALEKEKELNELKTRFVSMASHEFRTPLSSIQSSSSLIEKYKLENQQDNREKHVKKIKKNVHNLTMILNDFLSLEKIEGGIIKNNPEPVDLESFIVELLEESRAITKPNQRISAEYNHTKDRYQIDAFLLRNTLNNLLSNASKYSDEDIVIHTSEDDKRLTIAIIDKGIGISEEDQENLFNRFYRASNAANIQGTGLGLNIVSRYAKIMNADVNFESTLGKGSTFSIHFKIN